MIFPLKREKNISVITWLYHCPPTQSTLPSLLLLPCHSSSQLWLGVPECQGMWSVSACEGEGGHNPCKRPTVDYLSWWTKSETLFRAFRAHLSVFGVCFNSHEIPRHLRWHSLFIDSAARDTESILHGIWAQKREQMGQAWCGMWMFI